MSEFGRLGLASVARPACPEFVEFDGTPFKDLMACLRFSPLGLYLACLPLFLDVPFGQRTIQLDHVPPSLPPPHTSTTNAITVNSLTYNLTLLRHIVVQQHRWPPWLYHFSVNGPDLHPSTVHPSCARHPPSPAFQVTDADCYSLAQTVTVSPALLAALPKSLGVSASFAGGSECGGAGRRRNATLLVECGALTAEGGPLVDRIAEQPACSYVVAIRHPSGCPLQCPAGGDDLPPRVCSGHGVCVARGGAGVACACREGFAGSTCAAAPRGFKGEKAPHQRAGRREITWQLTVAGVVVALNALKCSRRRRALLIRSAVLGCGGLLLFGAVSAPALDASAAAPFAHLPPPGANNGSALPSPASSMLRACSLEEGWRPFTRAIPILPTTSLIHAPAYPNWAPFLPGPCVVREEVLLPGAAPAFSVQVNVWNRERQIRVALVQLLKLTREPWELIVIVDGATDDSLGSVNEVLDGYLRGWPACGIGAQKVVENASDVWPSGTEALSIGNVGVACALNGSPPRSLVRALLITVPVTGYLGTFANNLHMRVAAAALHPAEFFIFVDDDQFMTVPGWNVWLAHPARTFRDVFTVSMRCAHGWPDSSSRAGAKCGNTLTVQRPMGEGLPAGQWRFFVRDSGNRGPLLVRAAMARELGYLDEVHFAGVWTDGSDDHELNKRAYGYGTHKQRRWVSGVLPIHFTEERCCRSAEAPLAAAAGARLKEWWQARRDSAERLQDMGGSSGHDAERMLSALPLVE